MTEEARLAALLVRDGHTLITAESCTGGMICARLTEQSGSSDWLEGGFVTYALRLKSRALGVSEEDLHRWGAVSEPVAKAMAIGALEHSAATVSVSVTGVAGPSGGDVVSPVGTVWFGWAIRDADGVPAILQTSRSRFEGDRRAVRDQAVDYALSGLLDALEEK